ncbi:NUDIX hydrolase [Hartmannibacter diazotrophicus]|nr:NUDIX hydrolase [Hartmannibacter diazotrophicus]
MTLAPGTEGGIAVANGVFSAEAVDVDFSTFLAWRDWGFPEMGFRNVFGSPLILSADGCLLYGLMAGWTANAGMIYPPGGSLEPRDIRSDGVIDVLGSIETELLEETGLGANDALRRELLAVFDGPRVSLAEVLRFDVSAEHLQARARAHIAADTHPELDDLVILRSPADLDQDRTPAYAMALARHLLD